MEKLELSKEDIDKYQRKVVEKVKELSKTVKHEDEKIQPIVYALLVYKNKEGKIETEEAYRSELFSGDHAEFNLFNRKLNGENYENAVLFVSLEPCSNESRISQISCSEIISKARIKKVYMGSFDPDNLVRGNGYVCLTKNGIKVELFDEKYNKELIDINASFYQDRILDDENIYYIKFNENFTKTNFISDEAIKLYMYLKKIDNSILEEKEYNLKSVNKEIDDYYKGKEKTKIYKDFFEHCFNKYLFNDIVNQKRYIRSDIGFDVAFFNHPSNKFKGSYIKIISKINIDETAPIIYDGPMLISLINAYKRIMDIIKRLSNNKDINRIIREVLVNSVCHKNYNSYTPILVYIEKNKITISNPVDKEYIDIEKLKGFEMPVNHINGDLCAIMNDILISEGEGKGTNEMKNYNENNKIEYNLITNILICTIEF